MNLQDYCDCGPCPVRKLHGPYTVVRASWMLRLQCLILLGIPVRLSPDSIPPLPPPESCTLPLPCGDWALFVKWPRLICKHKVEFKMECNWMGKVTCDWYLFDFFFILHYLYRINCLLRPNTFVVVHISIKGGQILVLLCSRQRKPTPCCKLL